jgi:uncharacterized membrane protein YfcA
METLILSIVAFAVAILTFFSGFGLGTILTPIFMIFFPVELAIGLTGVVHFFNNLFKLFLVGKQADKRVLIHFGIPAVVAAIFGSWLLFKIPDQHPLFTYELFGAEFDVYLVKLIIAILLIFFACMELIPFFKHLQFGKNKLPIGGILSGFFGGLSGNQGALRSAFLIKAGLSKEAFIATAVVLSTFVDFTRLTVYASHFSKGGLSENLVLITTVTLSGILGSYFGNRLLKKVTIHFLQTIVAILLVLISVALGAGIL